MQQCRSRALYRSPGPYDPAVRSNVPERESDSVVFADAPDRSSRTLSRHSSIDSRTPFPESALTSLCEAEGKTPRSELMSRQSASASAHETSTPAPAPSQLFPSRSSTGPGPGGSADSCFSFSSQMARTS